MEKAVPDGRVKATSDLGAVVRKRSAPIQRPVTKRGTITQAQADAAVRRYFLQTQVK